MLETSKASKEADLWATGCILYEVIFIKNHSSTMGNLLSMENVRTTYSRTSKIVITALMNLQVG
jgi:hypothetical protein